MDRWKSRCGKSKRRERNKKEDQRGDRRKKMQVREKVEKSQNTVLGSKRLGCLVRYYWYRYKNFRFCFNPCFGHHFFFLEQVRLLYARLVLASEVGAMASSQRTPHKGLGGSGKGAEVRALCEGQAARTDQNWSYDMLRSRRTRYHQMFIHYDTILQQGQRIPMDTLFSFLFCFLLLFFDILWPIFCKRMFSIFSPCTAGSLWVRFSTDLIIHIHIYIINHIIYIIKLYHQCRSMLVWKANVDLCVSLANSMGAEQVPFVVFLNPEGVKIFASSDRLEGLFYGGEQVSEHFGALKNLKKDRCDWDDLSYCPTVNPWCVAQDRFFGRSGSSQIGGKNQVIVIEDYGSCLCNCLFGRV